MNTPAENIHSIPNFAKGKRPPLLNRASVPFGKFLTGMPTAPLVDIAPVLNYPMDGNDRVGDCVVAGWDHTRQVITQLLTGTGLNFTQDQIWAFYKTQNPNFDPNGTASTNGPGSSSDQGMCIQTFLEYLVAQKYILGFGKIDQTNSKELQAAVYIGLAIMTGVILDQAQMDQFASGTWDNVPGSPVDGGHCIPVAGYPASGATCITWGALVNLTENFILKQMDEAWFIVTQAHVDHPNFRNNFDLVGFALAVKEITGGQVVIPVPQAPQAKPVHYFSKNLSMGQTDLDVLALQKCLNYDPTTALQAQLGAIGSVGHETNFFGALTFNAVQAFQRKYGIAMTGLVGPLTRAELNKLFSMSVSSSGISLIEGFEGFVSAPYQDQGGTWTIGFGFTHDINGNRVTANTPAITQIEATSWLNTFIVTYVDGVLGVLTKTINQNQLDSLTSFTYNLGIGTFQQSSICSKINSGQIVTQQDFTQYCDVNGKPLQDLIVRRQKEYALYIS